MTREHYHTAKEDYLIGSDIEAQHAIDFALALVDSKLHTTSEAGPEMVEKEEKLEALETAKYQLEELRDDVLEFLE